jgi:hypothetical protein
MAKYDGRISFALAPTIAIVRVVRKMSFKRESG